MEKSPEATNQGVHFHGKPYLFPCFRNVVPPYIVALSLPGFTMGLPIWYFSTLMVSNAPVVDQTSFPLQEHQPIVDTFPSPIMSLLGAGLFLRRCYFCRKTQNEKKYNWKENRHV
jgi:hypothetical protein